MSTGNSRARARCYEFVVRTQFISETQSANWSYLVCIESITISVKEAREYCEHFETECGWEAVVVLGVNIIC